MKYDVEHISGVRKKINIVMPGEKVGEKIDRAYSRAGQKAKIKGFRPGKAPRSVLEKYYRDQVVGEVLNEVIQEGYSKILGEGDLVPISYPHFGGEELKEGEDFAFSLTIDVKPKLDVKSYEGVELKGEKVLVKDEDIDAELERLRKTLAAKVPVEDRGIEKGDHVTIDFEGFVNGAPLEKGKAENSALEIGSNTFIPGFEDGLIGMKKGESGEVKAVFPGNYYEKDLAGKEALFRVTVKEIKGVQLPALDDEFAKDVGEFSSLADLKDRISSDIRDSREQQEKERLERELVDKILETNPFEVPESMIEKQIKYKTESMKGRMAGMDMGPEEMENSLRQMKEVIGKQAEKDVKWGLLLEAVAEKEGINISVDDVDACYADIAGKSGRPVEEIKRYYGDKKDSLMNSLMDKKVLDFLMGKAKIAKG